MTENQRETYLLMLFSGRSREATDYREQCEQDAQEVTEAGPGG